MIVEYTLLRKHYILSEIKVELKYGEAFFEHSVPITD